MNLKRVPPLIEGCSQGSDLTLTLVGCMRRGAVPAPLHLKIPSLPECLPREWFRPTLLRGHPWSVSHYLQRMLRIPTQPFAELGRKVIASPKFMQVQIAGMACVTSICQDHPGGPAQAAHRVRVSIDLRGYATALNAISQSQHTSVAALVRTALADWLKNRYGAGTGTRTGAAGLTSAAPMQLQTATVVKVTLRMPVNQASQLARQARAAELSQGVYVARLVDALPVVPPPPDLEESRAALAQSTATLAALSGDLRALVRILGQGPSPALTVLMAQAGGVANTIDRHLVLAASLMAALAPGRRAGFQPEPTKSNR